MIIACNKYNLLHSCKLPKKHYSITLFHWCLLWVQRTLTWIITVLEPNGIKKKTCAPCTIRYLFIIHLSNYYRHLQTTAKQSNWTNIYSTDRYAHSLANDILCFCWEFSPHTKSESTTSLNNHLVDCPQPTSRESHVFGLPANVNPKTNHRHHLRRRRRRDHHPNHSHHRHHHHHHHHQTCQTCHTCHACHAYHEHHHQQHYHKQTYSTPTWTNPFVITKGLLHILTQLAEECIFFKGFLGSKSSATNADKWDAFDAFAQVNLRWFHHPIFTRISSFSQGMETKQLFDCWFGVVGLESKTLWKGKKWSSPTGCSRLSSCINLFFVPFGVEVGRSMFWLPQLTQGSSEKNTVQRSKTWTLAWFPRSWQNENPYILDMEHVSFLCPFLRGCFSYWKMF